MKRVALAVGLGLAAVIVIALAATSQDELPTRIQEIDRALPPIDGRTLDGSPLIPDDFVGRPVIVNFWATWCDPCRREQPLLARAHRASEGEVAYLGVDYRDRDGPARRWIADYDVGYPNLADPDGVLAERFGVIGLPTTLAADADGRLRFQVQGELDQETLDELLERLAEPSGGPP